MNEYITLIHVDKKLKSFELISKSICVNNVSDKNSNKMTEKSRKSE